MAHTCPDCGGYCTCCDDIDDIEFADNSFCLHYQRCKEDERDEDYEEDDYPDEL